MNQMFQRPQQKQNSAQEPTGLHASLEAETEKNEKGFVDFYIKVPWDLKDQLKAEYETRKASGEKVFRMWNPDRKKFKCNKAWAQIVSDIVSGKSQPTPSQKQNTPEEIYDAAFLSVQAAIEAATSAGDSDRIKAFTEAKIWIQHTRK